jgi:hypothetical protein
MLLPAVRWDARKTGGGPCCQARTTALLGQDDGAASTLVVLLGARWCCCEVPWRGYHVAAVLIRAWWCGATGVVARRCCQNSSMLVAVLPVGAAVLLAPLQGLHGEGWLCYYQS